MVIIIFVLVAVALNTITHVIGAHTAPATHIVSQSVSELFYCGCYGMATTGLE